jgi:hypothetical protein
MVCQPTGFVLKCLVDEIADVFRVLTASGHGREHSLAASDQHTTLTTDQLGRWMAGHGRFETKKPLARRNHG